MCFFCSWILREVIPLDTTSAKTPNDTSSVGEKTVTKTDNFNKQIPTHQKIFYGFGDFGNGFMFDLGQAYLTKLHI